MLVQGQAYQMAMGRIWFAKWRQTTAGGDETWHKDWKDGRHRVPASSRGASLEPV